MYSTFRANLFAFFGWQYLFLTDVKLKGMRPFICKLDLVNLNFLAKPVKETRKNYLQCFFINCFNIFCETTFCAHKKEIWESNKETKVQIKGNAFM